MNLHICIHLSMGRTVESSHPNFGTRYFSPLEKNLSVLRLLTRRILDDNTCSTMKVSVNIQVTWQMDENRKQGTLPRVRHSCNPSSMNQQRLTIIEILLDYQLILLLVSSTNHKIILTANKPVELLKPEAGGCNSTSCTNAPN